jgi:hypothetical protein
MDQAIAALAERSVALSRGAPRLPSLFMQKTAFSLQDVGNAWQGLDPSIQHAAMGAGIGGGMGLASSLFKDPEERRPISSALTGALAGGAIGGGLSLAARNAPESKPQLDAQGRPKLPLHYMYGPDGKTTYKWKPGSETPEAQEKLKALKTQGEGNGVTDTLNRGLYEGLWNQPIAQNPLTAMGTAGSWINSRLRNRTGIDPSQSGNLNHARGGLDASLKNMEVKPGEPATPDEPAVAPTVLKGKPQIDPNTGEQIRDASDNILRNKHEITEADRIADKGKPFKAGKPATDPSLKNTSELQGGVDPGEYEGLQQLHAWSNAPNGGPGVREFLQHRDFNQLPPEIQAAYPSIRNLRPETIGNMQRLGVKAEIPEEWLKKGLNPGSPLLRRSRLYDTAHEGGLLHGATGGRSENWGGWFAEPHVNTGTPSGLRRTRLKNFALPVIMAGLERMGWAGLRQHGAQQDYLHQILQNATEEAPPTPEQ